MHNQEYIASGVLELYAAGGLTPPEREEVERRAAASPEVRAALDEACMAMEAYAGVYAATPDPALKQRIMQRLVTADATHNNLSAEETPVRPLLNPENDKVASPYKWLFAASIALFLLTGFLSFHFYSKWQQAEQRLAGVIASEQLLAQNITNASLQLQDQEKALSVLRDPEFKQVLLKGVAAHPEAAMRVYWNARQQEVYVDNIALPAPPAGKQYQLWALDNGKPVDAGLIEAAGSKARLQQMKNIRSAQAFAVTLEPTGGSKEPTLDQLTVMGNTDS